MVIAHATTTSITGKQNIMKYNININQSVLASTSLDIVDCAILDWLVAFCNSTNAHVQKYRDDNGYTWVSYSILLRDMPLLRIKAKSALSKRIKNIKDAGFVDTYIKNGDRLFVKLTPLIDTLVFSTVHQNEHHRSPKETLPFAKTNATVRENEPTIIQDYNTSTKLVSITKNGDDPLVDDPQSPVARVAKQVVSKKAKMLNSPYDESFETFWAIYPEKVGKGKAYEVWQLLEKPIKQKCIDAITEQVEKNHFYKDWLKKNSVPHPTTWLNQRRWEDVIKVDNSLPSNDPKYSKLKVHTA